MDFYAQYASASVNNNFYVIILMLFFEIKKMVIEIILCVIAITPYIIIFMFFKRFRYIINIIMDIENMFDLMEAIPNETVDVVDTPAETLNNQIIGKN